MGLFTAKSQCELNQAWMASACPVSCGQCQVQASAQPQCEALYRDCDLWAAPGGVSADGECVVNPGFMIKNCRKQCDPECGVLSVLSLLKPCQCYPTRATHTPIYIYDIL